MKSTLKYISVFFAFMLIGSCDNFLEIVPKDRVTEESFYQDAEDASATVTSCYDPLKMHHINVKFFYTFTAFSDHSVHENTTMDNFAFSTTTSEVLEIYTYLFKGNFRCNLALEKIPPIKMVEDEKKVLLAQVYFLRALYNFYLTTIYNEPPLILEVIDDLDIRLSNSTRQEFKTSIVSDLKMAIAGLPPEWNDANLGRATKGAALAYLGKTYLYYQQHDSAAFYFKQVLDLESSGVYGLLEPQGTDSLDYIYAYQANFSAIDLTTPGGNVYDSENNLESVFEIQFNYGGWQIWDGGWQADGSITDLYFGPEGYKNLAPTTIYRNRFETTSTHPAGLVNDPRRTVTFYEPGDIIYYIDQSVSPIPWNAASHMNGAISQGFGWAKYFSPAHQSNNGPTNLKLMRYADVLLMMAEADFMVNGETSTALSLECINKVRNRAGLEPITEVTREAIMHEREVELGFEWLRFFDLVRWSQLEDPWVDITAILPSFIQGKNEYLPIPLAEINLARGALEQNPGW